ncbi:hypothetical protein [Terricaulis sp.]|uniref:hypothetical protein n=1 Tax=Terricaulis sp. TaxID=2768686 RepID=UPI002AC72E61|nr:hypothetical protein [Terricaulis sp.]MDZ4690842.1 hypothetical protein [Terricaulis sp.]
MKTSHIVLVAMAVLIATVGVAALAGPPLLRMMSGQSGDGRISIAIATPSVLDALEGAERQREERAEAQAQAQQSAATTVPAATTVQNGVATTPTAAPDTLSPAQMASMLRDSSMDGLAAEISGRLTRTQRFDVKDTSQFMNALREISSQPQSDTEPRDFVQSLRFWERRVERQQTTNQTTQTETETSGGAEARRGNPYADADLSGAGQRLNADYVLVVAIGPGNVEAADSYASAENPYIEFDWAPVLIYRVFHAGTGNIVLSEQSVVAPAIRIRWDRNSTLASFDRERELALNDRIAQIITRDLLNTLAPARIVRGGDTLTINRGSTDGIAVGQIYDVEREQEEGAIQDIAADGGNSGVHLGTIREPVGQLRIISVQDNFATASPVEGSLSRGDIVVITPGRSRALSVGTNASAGAQSATIGENAASNRTALAVGDMRVELLEPPNWRTPQNAVLLVTRAISGRLVESDRIEVLTRSDLARLQAERDLAARAGGVEDANLDYGLATANFLLTGEVQISASQAGESISVGGETRQTRTAWRLLATGTMRVQTIDGRTLYSVPVRTQRPGSPQDSTAVNAIIDAFAADAAAALLVRMFPIRVVSEAGGTLTLNRGTEAGLREGTRLAAFRVDTATRTRQRLGEVVVTDAAPGYNASARFAGPAFATNGVNVELEILSGAAPSSRPRNAGANASTPAEPAAAPVQW